MASRQKRTLIVTLIVILGCGVLSFIFWSSDKYRAATPLVFIFGAIILLVPAINSLIKLFIPREKRAMLKARMAAAQAHVDEQRLWRSGNPQLVTSMYFSHIRNYPEWIRESRDYVPSSITNAGKTDEGWVRLLMYYADYIFPYKEWVVTEEGGGEYKQAVLEVVREGVRVLTLRVAESADADGVLRWTPTAIEGFTVGPWIDDFRNLKTEILAILKDREREAREN